MRQSQPQPNHKGDAKFERFTSQKWGHPTVFEIDSWHFQQMLDSGFSETSQNSSFLNKLYLYPNFYFQVTSLLNWPTIPVGVKPKDFFISCWKHQNTKIHWFTVGESGFDEFFWPSELWHLHFKPFKLQSQLKITHQKEKFKTF